jgi:hypothetical protein
MARINEKISKAKGKELLHLAQEAAALTKKAPSLRDHEENLRRLRAAAEEVRSLPSPGKSLLD